MRSLLVPPGGDIRCRFPPSVVLEAVVVVVVLPDMDTSAVAAGMIQSFKNLPNRSAPLETALAARKRQKVSTTRGSAKAVLGVVVGDDGDTIESGDACC